MPRRLASWNPERDVWENQQADLFCARLGVWSETWPISGMTRNGVCFELPTLALHTGEPECLLLPTPAASDGTRGGPQHPEKKKAAGHQIQLADVVMYSLT